MTSLALCLWPFALHAAEVGVAGVIGSRALLIIDGASPRPVAVGQTVSGVRVISVQGDQVVLETEGKTRSLRIGQNVSTKPTSNTDGREQKAVLMADSAGHFLVTGAINGSAVRFIVDTGATTVAMGASEARRAKIDLTKGERGMTQTANGVAPVIKVRLDSVEVGGVTLHNVEATVLQTELPVVLLGMSFLNRMEMIRDGSTMTLRKRY